MGGSDGEAPLALTADAAREALALSAEPGWNQNVADWDLMLGLGTGFCYRRHAGPASESGVPGEGALVASGIALPFARTMGWVSMILVTARWRRRGLASTLLERCAAVIEATGRVAVLDATAEGARVYERHGFEPRFSYTRWERAPRPGPPVRAPHSAARGAADLLAIGAADLAARVHALDTEVFGDARPGVVDSLIERSGAAGAVLGTGEGFCLSREGRRVRQIGPLIAGRAEDAVRLLERAATVCEGGLCVDAVDEHAPFALALEHAGFVPKRALTRMVRGAASGIGDLERCFAVAGPELG